MTDLGGVRAVLADMDGTLVDSDAAVERLWRRWAPEHGVDPEAVVSASRGAATATTVRRFRPDLDDAAVAEQAQWLMAREAEDLEGVVAADGAGEFLARVEELGLPWAVVTNADRRLALARLGAAGITPPELVGVDEVTAGKPDPAGYLLGARRLGVEPGRCLVVEDSAPGVAAGRAAGAIVAGLRGVEADVPVAGLADLARRLSG